MSLPPPFSAPAVLYVCSHAQTTDGAPSPVCYLMVEVDFTSHSILIILLSLPFYHFEPMADLALRAWWGVDQKSATAVGIVSAKRKTAGTQNIKMMVCNRMQINR